VHARIGSLRGIDAVYYALTLPNASFTFSPAFEAPEHTINQPWTSVVLEGLRRMDEGIEPGNPFLEHDDRPEEEESDPIEEVPLAISYNKEDLLSEILSPPEVEAMGEFLSRPESESRWMKRPWTLGAVFAAVALIVAVVGVPWGLYARSKAAKLANEAKPASSQPAATNQSVATPAPSETSQPAPSSDAADLAAKRQRDERAKEKEKAKAQEAAKLLAKDPTAAANTSAAKSPSPTSGAKKVTVQVTYDENGRVTQASGGDATALRIARQKRFPAGKAGSATITIPIN
jgi:hypothetical protein